MTTKEQEREEERVYFRELWPDWTGRDPRLLEQVWHEDQPVPGCYRTIPAPFED